MPESLRGSRAVEVLERSLENERLGHGILLHGSSLEALTDLARAIAGTLLETDRDPFEHPDCFTLRPAKKSRSISIGLQSERTQGEWPPNTMRRLVADLQKTAHQGGRKVGVVFEADRMNPQAANAFLKTLEEPPAGTTLFLLTTRPYDLLDTIRSRCLNFRLPAGATAESDEAWTAWLGDYGRWIRELIGGLGRRDVGHAFMGAYGLNLRLQSVIAELAANAWAVEKERLPEGVTNEEKDAMEVGISKGFRAQLLASIEHATVRAAREASRDDPSSYPVRAVNQSIASLEKSSRMLDLNFNQSAALELFFLQSLRIWTAAR